jgi:hypothetical protein
MMDKYQAEMWAQLTGPPDQFVDLFEWAKDNRRLTQKLNRLSLIWNTVDTDTVNRKFKIACIRYAYRTAKTVQHSPSPLYWEKVMTACYNTINALQGIGDVTRCIDGARRASDSAMYDKIYGGINGPIDYAAQHSASNAASCAAFAASDDITNAAYEAVNAAIHAGQATYDTGQEDIIDIFVNIAMSEYENKRLTSDSHNAIVNL